MNLQAIDFSRSPARSRAGAWLLAAGMVALVSSLWLDHQWTAERAEAERLLQAELEAQRVAQRPVPVREPSASERRALRARSELQRPWMKTLSAIEAATVDPIFLLSASFEPAAGTIKLEAEAPSFDHALAYTQNLPEGHALVSAALASHEAAPDTPLLHNGVRFTVLARWGTP